MVGNQRQGDTMPRRAPDRRLLANIPDTPDGRVRPDRRGYREVVKEAFYSPAYIEKLSVMSVRYYTDYVVKVTCVTESGKRSKLIGKACDVSATGIRIEFAGDPDEARSAIAAAERFQIAFKITPGSLPEGYVARVNTDAELVRVIPGAKKHGLQCAFRFERPLERWNAQRKDRAAGTASAVFLVLGICFWAVLFRGTMYQALCWPFYGLFVLGGIYCACAYLFAQWYEPVPIDKDYNPGVTVLLYCHNAETQIGEALISCVNQEYPFNNLEVIILEDGSTDHSSEEIDKTLELIHQDDERFHTRARVRRLHMASHMGRGEALRKGMARARHNLIFFAKADGQLDPFAIRNIVQPFCDPKVAAVSGRVEVMNTYTNGLTRLQSVKLAMENRVLRAGQSLFDAVSALPEEICCFRLDLVWGRIPTEVFQDGRRLARQLVKKHRVIYQDTAICQWIAPNTFGDYLNVALNENRSLVRGLASAPGMWRKEPFMGAFYTLGACLFLLLPIAACYALYLAVKGWLPPLMLIILTGQFIVLAALQALLKKSLTWFSGMVHWGISAILLLWQIPLAWLTWGHRHILK